MQGAVRNDGAVAVFVADFMLIGIITSKFDSLFGQARQGRRK